MLYEVITPAVEVGFEQDECLVDQRRTPFERQEQLEEALVGFGGSELFDHRREHATFRGTAAAAQQQKPEGEKPRGESGGEDPQGF